MRPWMMMTLFIVACGDDSSLGSGADAQPSDARADGMRPDAMMAVDATAPDAGCGSGQLECAGVCVDTSTDSANCGACGHDCQGGACAAGMCLPIDLGAAGSTADGDGKALILDAQNIYWATSGSKLRRIAKSGGIAALHSDGTGILPDSLYPRITMDDAFIYWISPGSDSPPYNGTVARVALAGGAPTALATAQMYPADVAVHGGYVYWTVPYTGPNSDGKVMFMSRDGGAQMLFSTNTQEAPVRITVTPTGFAWSNFTQGRVEYTDFIGGGALPAVTNLVQPLALHVTVDGYFVATPNGPIRMTGSQRIEFTDQGRNDVLAVDSGYLYWSGTDGGDAAIKRAPIAGGSATILYRSPYSAVDLIVDDRSIYWIEDRSGGHLFKLAK